LKAAFGRLFLWGPGAALALLACLATAPKEMFAFVLRPAYLCLIALTFVVINLAVDMLYLAADPRLRVSDAKGY
jgi:peptide/nickel transport system permease protein